MLPPQLLVVQLEHQVIRGVVHHADLLEHDLPLELEILGADRRPEDDVGDHVRRLVQVLVEDARLEGGVLPRRVGVERPAELLERERDVARRTGRRPLEHHVLEEVRDTHPVARLVDRRRADPGPERD
ncbi:MAG TPA: hypothetical protein VFN39_09710 [Gemmatimonadaceae bacterium]|nr:hypothetical protein [Gemmatimonadaceae bacterium]